MAGYNTSARIIPTALCATRAARGRKSAELGRTAESIAEDFLRSRGLRILVRNFRRRLGEIDLVACDESILIVVEVRTRSSDRFGGPLESVDLGKQRRVALATALLLRRFPKLAQLQVRFDVVIVSDVHARNPRVQWIRQAFDVL